MNCIKCAYNDRESSYHIVYGEPMNPNDNSVCGVSVLKFWLYLQPPLGVAVCHDCAFAIASAADKPIGKSGVNTEA